MIFYTNDKNLPKKNLNADRVLRWGIILEEYVPDIEYIKDKNNIVADTLSRLPLNVITNTTQKSTYQEYIISEIGNFEELPGVTTYIPLKLIKNINGRNVA